MADIHEVIGDYRPFLEKINAGLSWAGIDRHDLAQLDHICWRTETLEEFNQMSASLLRYGDLVSTAKIAGRPIGTYRLHEPIKDSGWRVDAIELPAPKQSSPYESGLQHAEFVVCRGLAEFMKKYPREDWDTSALGRTLNPELALPLSDGLELKFHELSLLAVVNLEERLSREK